MGYSDAFAVLGSMVILAAAFIVFMGILNYVAYRDIFERRSENLPKTAARTLIGAPSISAQ